MKALFRTKRKLLIAAVITAVAALALVPVALVSCKNITLAEFAEKNTGAARVARWAVSPGEVRSGYKQFYNTVVFYPERNMDTGLDVPREEINLTIALDNPQNYELTLTPEWEVYNYKNERIPDIQNRVVTAEQNPDLRTGKIRIEHPKIGDHFRIRLNVIMADGSRIFEPYTLLPIVYNSRLDPPSALDVKPQDRSKTPGEEDAYPEAIWSIPQDDIAHPGIVKVTLNFREKIEPFRIVRAVYQRDLSSNSNEWDLYEGDPGVSTFLQSPPTGQSTYKVRFHKPIDATLTWDDDTLEGGSKNPIPAHSYYYYYNFTITLEDIDGLSVTTGWDAGELASEATMLKNVALVDVTEGSSFGISLSKFFKYTQGIVNYTVTLPYVVNNLRVDMETADEYQKIDPLTRNPLDNLTPGLLSNGDIPNHLSFKVTNDEYPDANQIYMFNIIRTNPDPDSYLKNPKVEVDDVSYPLMPAFYPERSDHLYTVYVPAGTSEVNVTAEPNSPLSKISMDHKKSNDPYKYWYLWQKKDDEEEQMPYGLSREYTFEDVNILYSYLYSYIDVKPEVGIEQTYTFMIVRASSGNPAANLKNLTFTGTGEDELLPEPEFTPDRVSYVVNVPYGTNSIGIGGVPADSQAVISNHPG
ncbi:MAG: hypothetical protein LBS48_01965, partial [Treponema sp.]|nr:hypothetical protein [Treponema sp.]